MRILIAMIGLLAAGQITEAPPMKMGLWEITSVTTSTFPPGMVDSMKRMGMEDGKPFTSVQKICVTPEQWRKTVGLDPVSKSCTYTRHEYSGRTMALSMTCSFGAGMSMAMDTTATFTSSESLEGNAHATTTYPANMMGGGKSVADSNSKGKFVSSDCGSVQPGRGLFSSGGR